MIRKLLRWCGCLILCGFLGGEALAQVAGKKGPDTEERRPPAPEYTLAILATMLILLILCMPTRKGTTTH